MEKELDNNYMSGLDDGQKRMSTDPVEVDNGLDSIIVSNVTQTLSGGLTIAAGSDAEGSVCFPAATPIIKYQGIVLPMANPEFLALPDAKFIGVSVHSFVYGKEPTTISVAKAAHINVDAFIEEYAKALEETGSSVQESAKSQMKNLYIGGDWHKSLCLTFEQTEE